VREDAVFRPHPRIAYRKIAGRMVIVHPFDNRLVTLNETGTRLFSLLDGRPVCGVVAAFSECYDVPLEQLSQDVREFLADLSARGLVVDDPGTGQ
jgi:hypothetical protein